MLLSFKIFKESYSHVLLIKIINPKPTQSYTIELPSALVGVPTWDQLSSRLILPFRETWHCVFNNVCAAMSVSSQFLETSRISSKSSLLSLLRASSMYG